MRRLYKYLGKTDALVELTELAARSFVALAKESENIDRVCKKPVAATRHLRKSDGI